MENGTGILSRLNFISDGINALYINALMYINAFEANRITPLMLALMHKCGYRTVKNLIDKGENINMKGFNGLTPLMIALQMNKSKEVIDLLIHNGANINAADNEHKTALIYALEHSCDKEIILEIINNRADVNAQDSSGSTCLMYAVKNIHCDVCIIDALICRGANVDALDKNNDTVLMYAVRKNGSCTPAIHRVDVKKIKYLLSTGCNVNCLDSELNSPLFYADVSETVDMLVYLGADWKTKKNIDNQVALEFKMYVGNEEGSNALIRHYFLSSEDHKVNECLNSAGIEDAESREYYETFSEKCRLEVNKMKETDIKTNLSLYDFCILKFKKTSRHVNIAEDEYLLDKGRIKNEFPIFHNIISLRIADNKTQKFKHDLCCSLEKLQIKPILRKEESADDVNLNYDCFYKIHRYLNHKDLYNVFLASILDSSPDHSC